MIKSFWKCYKNIWTTVITMLIMFIGTSHIFAKNPVQIQYDVAMESYEWEEYDDAMAVFEELLAQYPTSDLVDDIQYMF